MSRVAGARAIGEDAKTLADALSVEAESLQGEGRRFLADIEAA